MKYLFYFFLLFATTGFAQNPAVEIDSDAKVTSTTFAETITAEDLEKHLTTLASDEMEGRETGTAGQRKAAEYISNHFQSLGLPEIGDNQYQQSISFTTESWSSLGLEVDGKRFKNLQDFYAFPATNVDRKTFSTDEVIFLGYGIDDKKYSDYKGVEVKGKTLLIYSGEPVNQKGISAITGSKQRSDWNTDWRKKLKVAHEKGAALVLIIDPDIKKSISEQRRFLVSPKMRMGAGENPAENYPNNIFISSTIAKEIVGKRFKKFIKLRDKIKAKGKPKRVALAANLEVVQDKNVKQLLGSNVLGYIEGTDEKLKNEIIVVTAHYDHLGMRGKSIYNGADDNGSGTSTVLEISEALVEAKKQGVGPRRSVLTMLVSGEEKGLLGSKYYTEYPIFPLENTVANVNVDMVGRVDKAHADNPNYIYVIGSDRLSTELHEINETANKSYTQLELDYKYNAKTDPNRYYYRSDHYNFAEKGIPAIFYFNGTHEDYHRTSDTVDKINFEKMETIGRLVFYTVWQLANQDKRIEVDVKD